MAMPKKDTDKNPDVPEGMKEFTVKGKSAVCDSLGRRIPPKGSAILDETLAQHFFKQGLLEVELDFDTVKSKPKTGGKASGERKSASDSGKAAPSAGSDKAESSAKSDFASERGKPSSGA